MGFSMWDDPQILNQLMEQKLLGQGVDPAEIPQIMMQVRQAEGLKGKMGLTDGLPVGPEDTLSAMDNPAVPIGPPSMPQGPPEQMVTDQAAGAVSPSSPAPVATPEAQQASLMDRLGPEGFETLLNQGGIDEQRDQANLLRNQEGPKGMHTRSMYVAANPLSHLASGVEKYRAKKDIKRLRKEEKEGNRKMLELLRGADKKVEKADPTVGFGLGVI